MMPCSLFGLYDYGVLTGQSYQYDSFSNVARRVQMLSLSVHWEILFFFPVVREYL